MNPVLSAFRFYLAICVVASHFGGADMWGDGAVEAFFSISGFLVTMIVTESYAGRPGAYLLNRALRIYPVYWACLLLGLAIVAALPAAAHAENRALTLPNNLTDWLSQFVIFGLYHFRHVGSVRILPPAWSLNVELYFYFIVGLVTASRPRLTMALGILALAVSALAAMKLVPLPFYGDPLGNAQPFFFGSLAYHYKNRIRMQRYSGATVVASFLAVQLAPTGHLTEARMEIASVLAPLTLIVIWQADTLIQTSWRALFDLLGKLAYPIFLLHWIVAVPLRAAHLSRIEIFALCLPITVAVAFLVHVAVERPIETLRRTIRSGRVVALPFYSTTTSALPIQTGRDGAP